MTKLLLTTLFLSVALAAVGQRKQPKWVESGGSICIGCKSSDTATTTYTLDGKDSLTYTVDTQNCNCDFYTTIEDHKLHPCKGLRLHSVEVHFMDWRKEVTSVKGVKISETKPHWDSNMSESSFVNGEYEQNGKMVYIHSIHFLKHKLINNTQPYKFTSEWVEISEY